MMSRATSLQLPWSSFTSSKRAKANDVDHGLDPEWENVIKNHADRSIMNKLMAVVSLTTSGDPDSMVQYGGPIPEGQTDDFKANAIKADPTLVLPRRQTKATLSLILLL
ncbi:hypothetical protein AX14_004002 [Amanita brunnescens Koide BX004]|nr:hypothetical protein AX14_004002 [Amanita brunnescens Koide BX004]